jgi:hypothetical protein
LKNTFSVLEARKRVKLSPVTNSAAGIYTINNRFCFYRQKMFGMSSKISVIIKKNTLLFSFLIREIRKSNVKSFQLVRLTPILFIRERCSSRLSDIWPRRLSWPTTIRVVILHRRRKIRI